MWAEAGIPAITRKIFRTLENYKGMAERVGFEPTCRLPDKTLSRRPRYDHFGTSPVVIRARLRGLCAWVGQAGTRHYTRRFSRKNSWMSSRALASRTPHSTANR